VLYIGTSKDLRRRVRSYFTASETRSRMGEMVRLAESVEGITCATPLEAEVRELRLIGEHKPRYNRRSRHPERVVWLKLTREPWPRLSLVRSVLDDAADYVGPFGSRRTAERAMAAAHDAFAVRQCTGRWLAPCRHRVRPRRDGALPVAVRRPVEPDVYAAEVERLRRALLRDPTPVVTAADSRMRALSEAQRYEEASVLRDRLAAFVRITARSQRLSALTSLPEVVAARCSDGPQLGDPRDPPRQAGASGGDARRRQRAGVRRRCGRRGGDRAARPRASRSRERSRDRVGPALA
jgi:DNA polymerase-3 subunit epsilon